MVLDEAADAEVEPPGWEWEWEWEWEWWEWWWEDSPITKAKKVIASSRGLIISSGNKENQILPKHIKKSMGERRTIHFEFL